METRPSRISSPIRRDSPSNSNLCSSIMVPNRDNQPQSTWSPQMQRSSESMIPNTFTTLPQCCRMSQNNQPREPLRKIMCRKVDQVPMPFLPVRNDKIDGPQMICSGDKFGLFRLPTTSEEYATCERRFDWLQSEKNILERSLSRLEMERDIGSPQRLKSRQKETCITNSLNQVEREMSA
ncbi:unnamed protein product, partial [Hymenolepis diminuta]